MAQATATYSLEGLEERLAANCRFFDNLVNTIPAKYYVVTQGAEEHQNPKYLHNKRKRAPKQELKEASIKAKKAKLDPENQKTVAEVQAELLAKKRMEEEPEIESGVSDTVVPDIGVSCATQSLEVETTDINSTQLRPLPKSGSISDLRQRVQKKIAALQEKRRTKATTPLSRDEILQERKRRKVEKKEKLRKQKEAGKAGSKDASDEIIKDGKKELLDPTVPSADTINENSEAVFSKFAFGGEKVRKKGADVQSALKKAEAKAEKLAKIAAEDSAKAAKIAQSDVWRRASQLARGDKPKDDVRLLKKTIRRAEQVKKKSAREWKERQDAVEAGIVDRQRRRQENIKARAEEKKAGKQKKSSDKKKKKHRAGFEGR